MGAQTEGAPAAASADEILAQATEAIAGAGCETPEADAKLLIAKALSMRVEELERDGTTVITPEARAEIERYVARRRERGSALARRSGLGASGGLRRRGDGRR